MATSDDKMADTDEKIFIGKGDAPAWLTLALGNRHGLVTGATGTGKTVSLQVMAEGFARAGVPVFAADIKGDLSGISEAGEAKDFLVKRASDMGFTYQPDQFSTVFWDVFGEQGHPVRATVTEMGPLLLARMLDLNDVQEGVLNVAFRVADDNGLALIDMKDLRALLDAIVPDTSKKGDDDPLASIRKAAQGFGNVTRATVGTIQRQLLVLENQGGARFFGEPALSLKDFMRTDRDGRGMVNILVADKLMQSPRLYATFLLWMLSELFEELPEAGDPPKPKLVFFFDEAHLLFNDAPKALMGQDRAGGKIDPLQGHRSLFRDAEPGRCAGYGAGPIGQPRPARVAGLYAARPEGGCRGCTDVPAQSQAQHRPGHHGIGQGRSAGVVPGGQRHAGDGRADHGPAAFGADRTDHARGAQGDHGCESGEGQIRHRDRCRIRL